MKVTCFVVLTCCSFSALATSITDNFLSKETYYHRGAEGWYWYHDPVIKEKTEKEPTLSQGDKSIPSIPPVLSAAWVRKMIPVYRDKAWDNPTPQNVEAFFVLQRYAMDRSQEFAQVAQSVVLGNPYIDETYRRPISSFGLQTVDRRSGDYIDEILKKVAQKAGLFFFFQKNCSYCETQAPVVKMLEDQGFDVIAISIGEGELESVKFKNTRVDSGQASYLQVQVTPSIFLVNPEGSFQALASGIISLDDLKKRILVASARQGWLTPEEIGQTRPILNPGDDEHNLSKQMPKMLQASNTKTDPEGYIDPSILLSFLSEKRISGVLNHAQ